MVVEIKGKQLRIRILDPKRFIKFRVHDVGKRGKLQRLAAFSPRTGWKTQGWRINLIDFHGVNEVMKTIRSLRMPSKLKGAAIKKAKLFFKLRFTSTNSKHRHQWSPRMQFTTRSKGHNHKINMKKRLALPSTRGKHTHKLL